MPNLIETEHVESVKSALKEYADLFAVYASDQRAMISRVSTKREKADREARAQVYQDCADELRATIVSLKK